MDQATRLRHSGKATLMAKKNAVTPALLHGLGMLKGRIWLSNILAKANTMAIEALTIAVAFWLAGVKQQFQSLMLGRIQELKLTRPDHPLTAEDGY